jgi:hypothetical protein
VAQSVCRERACSRELEKEVPAAAFVEHAQRFLLVSSNSDGRLLVLHVLGYDACARNVDLTYRTVSTIFPSNVANERAPRSGYFFQIIRPECLIRFQRARPRLVSRRVLPLGKDLHRRRQPRS